MKFCSDISICAQCYHLADCTRACKAPAGNARTSVKIKTHLRRLASGRKLSRINYRHVGLLTLNDEVESRRSHVGSVQTLKGEVLRR